MIARILVKCFTGLAGGLIVASSFSAQDATPKTIQLPDGTPIHLYLKDDLDSKRNRKGDPIRFQVREDVVVRSVVVIPAGSPGQGHVTAVGHRSVAGHSGRLAFSVDYVTAPDGTKVAVASTPSVSGGSNGNVTAAAAAAYGPGALLMRGWNADIRMGTMLNGYVNGNYEIGMANLTVRPSYSSNTNPPQATPAGPSADALAPAATVSVTVKSTPDGADITVDGKFVGSTPSTLKLPPGDHTISVGSSRFKAWQRTMTLSTGSDVTLNATLEKE